MTIRTELEDIRGIVARARTVAVLGAHDEQARAAYYVPDYLAAQGYRILPVNPKLAGRRLWGQPVVATLGELSEPVDLVDVFRASHHLPGHLDDLLGLQPRPAVVWFQLGVRHDEVARALSESGMDVVQDRCLLADHRRFGIGQVTSR